MGLIHGETTARVIQAFYEVHREIGFGLTEAIYSTAMEIAMNDLGLQVSREVVLPVFFREREVGWFRADTIVESKVILEYKALNRPVEVAESQLMTYLRCTPIELGMILNFGPKPVFRRYIMSNEGKRNFPGRPVERSS